MYKNFFKRLIDIILSFFGILFLWPIMLIVAICIIAESDGPVLFKTERIGRNQKPFKFYKFRSMRTDAPKDCPPALLNSDAYITKVGKFIRKTSLDELPQLFCILKGNMSIIGYRPCGFNEQLLVDERERLGVHKFRPGLTGWAQVNGRDELARDMALKAKYDAEYCEKVSFMFDLKIFWMTIKNVLAGADVQEGQSEGFVNSDAELEIAADVVEKNDDNKEVQSDIEACDDSPVVEVENVEKLND